MIEGVGIEVVKIILKFILKVGFVLIAAAAFLYLVYYLGTYNFE